MSEPIELTGATVSGICPETGDSYTIAAGDKYVMPSGKVIDSAGFTDTATGNGGATDEQVETTVITAPDTEIVMPGDGKPKRGVTVPMDGKERIQEIKGTDN